MWDTNFFAWTAASGQWEPQTAYFGINVKYQ